MSHPPRRRQYWANSGPAARWIAPSTPPPPSSDELAALTIASTSCCVMSPATSCSTTPFTNDERTCERGARPQLGDVPWSSRASSGGHLVRMGELGAAQRRVQTVDGDQLVVSA